MLRSFQEVAFEYARVIEKSVARFLVERCGGERTCSTGLNCLSPERRRYKWLTPRHGPRGGEPLVAIDIAWAKSDWLVFVRQEP